MPTTRKPTAARIQSLARAGAILDVLLKNGTVQLRDIAEATSLNKTTAYYLAESLCAMGLAERFEAGYRLGLRNLELGLAVQRRLDITEISRPSLIRLCALSRETVNLALPFVFDAMIIESLEGTHGVRATSYAGSRAPYHATACGKALLAHFEPKVREAIYAARPFRKETPHTIDTGVALESELEMVRIQGYALDLEEMELNAHCVAAPIWDPSGSVVGAISISGLSSRWPKEALLKLTQPLLHETQLISKALRVAPVGKPS